MILVIFCCFIIQGFVVDLGEGIQRLNDVIKIGENILFFIFFFGQIKICKELSVMKRDFEEYYVMFKEV